MAVFALADLHLGFSVDKPMDIFGDQWKGHPEKIEANWRETVGEGDTVLLPGDLSWGMTFEEARPDLEWIGRLPGRKILVRGNHDYWWSKIGQLRELLPTSMTALQNDVVSVENLTIAGSRGWDIPIEGLSPDVSSDAKVFERERLRLKMSLEKAPKDLPIVVMMHFPPFVEGFDHAGFSDILERFGVRAVVFGHYHGPDAARAFTGRRGGVNYIFCAADGVGFRPVPVDF